jgi:hypothetical protein
MNIGARPLPLAEQIVEATGLKVTYPFDDLVFVEHNPFLLRFDDENFNNIYVHFNVDCHEVDKKQLLDIIEKKAHSLGMKAIATRSYTMKQKEGVEEIEIEFSAS